MNKPTQCRRECGTKMNKIRCAIWIWVWVLVVAHAQESDTMQPSILVSATGLAVPCLVEGEGAQKLADKGVAEGPAIAGTWQTSPLVVTTSKVVGADALVTGGHLIGEFPDTTASNGCHFVEVVLLCKIPKAGRVLDFSGLRMKIKDSTVVPTGLSVPTLGGYEYFKKGMGVMEFQGQLSAVGNCKFTPGLVIGIAGELPSQCPIRVLFQVPQQTRRAELVLGGQK